MIAEQPTRKMVQALKAAGWIKVRSSGSSHSVWKCSSGKHQMTVPDGHRTISPGVVRKINDAMANCKCGKE